MSVIMKMVMILDVFSDANRLLGKRGPGTPLFLLSASLAVFFFCTVYSCLLSLLFGNHKYIFGVLCICACQRNAEPNPRRGLYVQLGRFSVSQAATPSDVIVVGIRRCRCHRRPCFRRRRRRVQGVAARAINSAEGWSSDVTAHPRR